MQTHENYGNHGNHGKSWEFMKIMETDESNNTPKIKPKLNFPKNIWKPSQFLDFFPLPERSELELVKKTLPGGFSTTNG